MDPYLLHGNTVAAVTDRAAQLAQGLFKASRDAKNAKREVQEVANKVSLLSMSLESSEDALQNCYLLYQPAFASRIVEVAEWCRLIFSDIEKIIGFREEKRWKSVVERLGFCLEKDRRRLLLASLESLKSTLIILLHVVALARLHAQDPDCDS